jgi:glucan phosphoethanolaminetransferase (alkaline phosphatase superfamily)
MSIIDLTMIDLYKDYLLPGGILSTIKTNPQEAAEFYNTNLKEVFRWIPLIICCIVGCCLYQTRNKLIPNIVIVIGSIIIPTVFVTGKVIGSYDSKITFRYYIDHRIWNRTPYNVVFQSINTVKELNKRKYIEHTSQISFGAHQETTTSQKEVYIFAIGESLRYDNLSLNGKYARSTTPLLEQKSNLLLFHNYYSQACLTMYSVPQLVTRATPDNYDLNFKERSIVEPFRECGFKTYTIVSQTNLLSYEKYLSNGVDSLIIVPNIVQNGEIIMGDKTMVHIVDSLMQQHDKLFIMMQFLGNQSFFTNYEKEFDIYKPNSNSCTDEERLTSDSLLINAYDNSILYTDWVLSSIIDVIDRPDIVSSFVFVSDHGEHISKDGAGHGGNCSPVKEEYHVPFIFWWSDEYEALYPEKTYVAKSHTHSKINGDCIFYSLCDMADIQLDSIYATPSWSVFSSKFEEHPRLILLPDGINSIAVD